MAVPDFQTLMRPFLVALDDGSDRSISDLRDGLVTEFSLDQTDIEERIPSGRVTTFQNRVGWAATYLYRAKLIERPRRATYRITTRGRETLSAHSSRIDLRVLSGFPEFEEFRQTKASGSSTSTAEAPNEADSSEQTPEEAIEAAHQALRAALAADLLDRVFDQSPEFFEQLVLDVLHAMGYGGRRDDAAQRLGRSGDEGVDGVIREDTLGLDLIYVQAKRWSNVVGRPEIQKFFGALHGQRATKGVFITTSTFSGGAIEYADGVSPRVILIDGKELAQLMLDHSVGVTVSRAYEIKRLDLDYFVGDEDDSQRS